MDCKLYSDSADYLSGLVWGLEFVEQAAVVASLEREVLGLNKKARQLFGYESDEIVGSSTSILYQNLSDFDSMGKTRYYSTGAQDAGDIIVDYKSKSGRVFLGKTSGGVIKNKKGASIGFIALISDESARLAVEDALNKLHTITSSRQLSFKERVDEILKLGNDLFKLPIGIFSKIQGNEYTIRQATHPDDLLDEGMTFNLEGTYCSHVYAANDVQGFNHVSQSRISTHPCFKNFGLEAYIGCPIFVDGERYGTLNFSSDSPCRPFVRQDFELVKLFSNWIGHELARQRDINALKDASKEMESIANTDSLTGLKNRRFMEEALKHLIVNGVERQAPLAVAIIDFDHFKLLNDKYGHSAGDEALTSFGKLARTISRKSDIYGRWGGEEFVAVFPGLDLKDAEKVLLRLTKKLKALSLSAPAEDAVLTVSIGLTSLRMEDTSDSLIQRADKLLYEAKENGRDQIQTGE